MVGRDDGNGVDVFAFEQWKSPYSSMPWSFDLAIAALRRVASTSHAATSWTPGRFRTASVITRYPWPPVPIAPKTVRSFGPTSSASSRKFHRQPRALRGQTKSVGPSEALALLCRAQKPAAGKCSPDHRVAFRSNCPRGMTPG